MEGDEFEALKKDIQKHGQQEPIIAIGETILDGRNRYNACKQLNHEGIQARVYEDGEITDLVNFVLSSNLHRRHLNESQRAMVAAKLANLKPGANQHTKKGPSIEGASKILGIGHASAERAKKVIDKGAPELVKAVEQGTIRVSAAEKLLDKNQDEQRKVLADPHLLKAALKPKAKSNGTRTKLDDLRDLWEEVDTATQEAFVEAEYQTITGYMKAIETKAGQK